MKWNGYTSIELEQTIQTNMELAHISILDVPMRNLSSRLASSADSKGRFSCVRTMRHIAACGISCMQGRSEREWLEAAVQYVLSGIFPGEPEPENLEEKRTGILFLLNVLRSQFQMEKKYLQFDPHFDFHVLSLKNVKKNGYTQDYIKMLQVAKEFYVYEMMRIHSEVTPFDALAHIGGVHWVAMYMAYQLAAVGEPVDLGLISGAAAGHDIGKYGCRGDDEKRVPYLHYYYTDICYRKFGLESIGHIAANHSVWDLELENLSVESLLLIYSDFRVKSTRGADGKEIVHFYSLKESFDVILNKLDNVDAAKEQRYRKVYAKLADFEEYMHALGVRTALDPMYAYKPEEKPVPIHREAAMLEGKEVVRQFKFGAISHNIRMMSIFYDDAKFTSLIEAARSEQNWENVRTYVNILEEYSTYMSEHQELLTLNFLYELLFHREEDIRRQSANLMGRIVANYNELYTKELPKGVVLPGKEITNITLCRQYLEMIIRPDLRFTDQHKLWVGSSLSAFVKGLMEGCAPKQRKDFLDQLLPYYESGEYSDEVRVNLLQTLLVLKKEYCDESFLARVQAFIKSAAESGTRQLNIFALQARLHLYQDISVKKYWDELLQVMDLPASDEEFAEAESRLFLDDLKMGVHWGVKVANIDLMREYTLRNRDRNGAFLHIGTHLVNLLKVSERAAVRQAAGNALLSVIKKMPSSQVNELAIELYNGLDIGDRQFATYVPEYLGRTAILLPEKEFDEMIDMLEQSAVEESSAVAKSIMDTVGVILDHYDEFSSHAGGAEKEHDERRQRLLGILLRGYAHYDRGLSREAFRCIGKYIFIGPHMEEKQRERLFTHGARKLLCLLMEDEGELLDFYSDSAVLNHLYRYLTQKELGATPFKFKKHRKVAFYPGTFDPFSLGHKAVACQIRDMGFDVYLAIDEFSWSKHTQPRLLRRRIMNMSVADEEGIYPFPDDISVNIANPDDLAVLKNLFRDKDLYIAVGTDVIRNASAYRKEPEPDSIHMFNHIAFERETDENPQSEEMESENEKKIQGEVVHLKLDKFYEDISSSRIRENVDMHRDISNLIDPVAQNFIYDRGLYLREPAYKHVLEAREIGMGSFKSRGVESIWPIMDELQTMGYDEQKLETYLEDDRVRSLYIEAAGGNRREMAAYAAAHRIGTRELLSEFRDPQIAAHIRQKAGGNIAVIGFLFARDQGEISNVGQMVLTEILSALIERDFTYAVYDPVDPAGLTKDIKALLVQQGFVNIAPAGRAPIYAVDMHEPKVIFRDVETVIKDPFNRNPRVLEAIDTAHRNLLGVLTRVYPGELILSYNTSAVHYKIIRKVADINGVSVIQGRSPKGPYMLVPFGKTLGDVVVPNTVTKSLNLDKYFNRTVKGFKIREARNYSSMENQAKMIKSFHQPVILVDDLLHKGHRMRNLLPILQKVGVDIHEVLVAVMTGNAMDMMAQSNVKAESAYFVPNLSLWLNERDCYPFIGGDSIEVTEEYLGLGRNPSVNLILPYIKPQFIGNGGFETGYEYSRVCLENALHIWTVLEEEYQKTYERKMTLSRIGEVLTYPRVPDIDLGVKFDQNLGPTSFIINDIERVIRLKWGE